MRILLIGATGQIGYALAHALARSDHELAVLVRNRRRLAFPPGVRVFEQPVFSPGAFRDALAGIDHVIYGVGLPEQFQFDTTIFDRVNYGLLKTFLDSLRQTRIHALTYISTYEVFEAVGGLIRESCPVADERHMTPYFGAMVRAYRLVTGLAAETGLELTTIHPAALYGGLNTGRGITHYIANLAARRWWAVPFVVPGRFPVVHADSLAEGIRLALGHPGAYIISDQMTDLREIAVTVRRYTNAYVPPVLPVWLAKVGARGLEQLAQLTGQPPIMSRVQVQFITQNAEPRADKLRAELDWRPLALADGLRQYLTR